MKAPWSRRNGSHKINPLGLNATAAPQQPPAAGPSTQLPPLPRPPSQDEAVDLEAGNGSAPRPYHHPLRPWHHPKDDRGGPATATKAARAKEERSPDEELELLGEDSTVKGMLALAPRDWLKPPVPKQAKPKGLPQRRVVERRSTLKSAHLNGQAFTWGDTKLLLEEILAVSCCEGSRLITLHAYPRQSSCLAPCARRRRASTKLALLAPTPAEAWMWAAAFADRRCHMNMHASAAPQHLAPTPGEVATAGRPVSPLRLPAAASVAFPPLRLRPSPVVAVIINPKSGRGRALRIFATVVRPMLELAGFKLTVMETTGPRHAVKLAASLSLATCPDGIICVGGDGIVNEVLNGLYAREDSAAALALPIGVVPAGSDNSLVWSVLGISNPISACLAIVKGRTVHVDAILVQWEGAARAHVGLTIAYFGFMSDVLELSGKYQGRFGPLRYVIAGAQRLLKLPVFHFDIEYLPCDEGGDAPRSCVPGSPDCGRLHAYGTGAARASTAGAEGGASLSCARTIDGDPHELQCGASFVEGEGDVDLPAGAGRGGLAIAHASGSARDSSVSSDLEPSLVAVEGPAGLTGHPTTPLARSRSLGEGAADGRGGRASRTSPLLRGHGEGSVSPAFAPPTPSPPSSVPQGGAAPPGTRAADGRGRLPSGQQAAVAAAVTADPRGAGRQASRSPSLEPGAGTGFRNSSSVPHLLSREGAVVGGPEQTDPDGALDGQHDSGIVRPRGDSAEAGGGSPVPDHRQGFHVRLPTGVLARGALPVAGGGDGDAAAGGAHAEGTRSGPQWVLKRGPFLAIMVCNHGCKSVQCLESQALAPCGDAEDGCLDLLLCRKVGRLQLLRFLILLQFGRHVSLPYVEYTKVKAVKITPGPNRHKGCGIDGELLQAHEPVMASVMQSSCCLMGGLHGSH